MGFSKNCSLTTTAWPTGRICKGTIGGGGWRPAGHPPRRRDLLNSRAATTSPRPLHPPPPPPPRPKLLPVYQAPPKVTCPRRAASPPSPPLRPRVAAPAAPVAADAAATRGSSPPHSGQSSPRAVAPPYFAQPLGAPRAAATGRRHRRAAKGGWHARRGRERRKKGDLGLAKHRLFCRCVDVVVVCGSRASGGLPCRA